MLQACIRHKPLLTVIDHVISAGSRITDTHISRECAHSSEVLEASQVLTQLSTAITDPDCDRTATGIISCEPTWVMQCLHHCVGAPTAPKPFVAQGRPFGTSSSRRSVRVFASHVAYKELRAVAEKAAKAGAEVGLATAIPYAAAVLLQSSHCSCHLGCPLQHQHCFLVSDQPECLHTAPLRL